ncbi:MAG: hypothetical protein WBB39_03610 [Candidatus Saccharimonadales bacterium]
MAIVSCERSPAYSSAEFFGDFNEGLRPTMTPALAIQTYESFESDKTKREAAEALLIAGEVDDIAYEYTKLFDEQGRPVSYENEKKSLEDMMTRLRDPQEQCDDEVAAATFMTVLFRYKEIEFLETVQQLNRCDISNEEQIFFMEKYRRLNEQLYGAPDPDIYDMLRGEVWSAIDSHVDSSDTVVMQIKSELENGFSARGRDMAGLERGHKGIVRLTPEAAQWIREIIYEEYGAYFDLAKNYWEKVVVPRAEWQGVEPEFTGEELVDLFELALQLLDPEGTSGITIRTKPNNSNLSWNTPTMSVDVGMASRATPVDSAEKAFGKLLHELLGHGRRTSAGAISHLPVTGFGVFSKFLPGGNPDYLTVEEGILTLLESIVCGEIDSGVASQWKSENVRHYLGIAMAELDARDTAERYELTWRYSVLVDLKPGQNVTDKAIQKSKLTAARSNVRYKRSLPADMPEGYEYLTWHKDLAYALGRIKATPLFQDIYERRDKESLLNLFKTHTDPTNPYQNRLARLAGYPVTYSKLQVIPDAA